jgi:hypothetical protein
MLSNYANVIESSISPVPESEVHALADGWFLAHLREIRTRACASLHRFRGEAREEAVAEVLAHVFSFCLSAVRRGTLARITPYYAVVFACRRYFSGRRFCRSSSTDAMGEATKAKGRVAVQSLQDTSFDSTIGRRQRRGYAAEPLAEVLSDRREQNPFEKVRQSLDYVSIFRQEKVSRKARKTFRLLSVMRGVGAGEQIARQLGVSPARVCHLKAQLAAALRRHEYLPPPQRTVLRSA